MARGSKRGHRRERDVLTIANYDDQVPLLRRNASRVTSDLRAFNPDQPGRPASLKTDGRPASVTVKPARQKWKVIRGPGGRPLKSRPGGVRKKIRVAREAFKFINPKQVWVCIRRKMRREVLFALNRRGKGGGRRRRTWRSNVEC